MKSINRRFQSFKEKNETLGDYVVLVRTVRDQKFSKQTIRRWFGKLVEKTDYDSRDRMSLIDNLFKLSNPVNL